MKTKLTFLVLFFSTEVACMDTGNDNSHHETRVLKEVIGILKRQSRPEIDFRAWCLESSRVFSASEKDVLKRLGTTLGDIHMKTSSLASTVELAPMIKSIVNTFVDAIKHDEPNFSLRFWEPLFVATHVTPWAYKSICRSSEDSR